MSQGASGTLVADGWCPTELADLSAPRRRTLQQDIATSCFCATMAAQPVIASSRRVLMITTPADLQFTLVLARRLVSQPLEVGTSGAARTPGLYNRHKTIWQVHWAGMKPT